MRMTCFLLLCMLCSTFVSCSKRDDSEVLSKSKQLAEEFHKAVMKADVEAISALVDYPFSFDRRVEIESHDTFMKTIRKKLGEMQSHMQSARKMEAVTYEAFIEGEPVRGKSLEGDAAKSQAQKIGFAEGGILVRCYHVDKENRSDGREYYVVIGRNKLGDLKIHTYYD